MRCSLGSEVCRPKSWCLGGCIVQVSVRGWVLVFVGLSWIVAFRFCVNCSGLVRSAVQWFRCRELVVHSVLGVGGFGVRVFRAVGTC
jgi:hypothetical protein